MVEIIHIDQRNGNEEQSGRNPGQQVEHNGLFKLAERAVIQAETLAVDIVELAKVESEAQGARLLVQFQEEAKEEARRIIESTEQKCVSFTKEAKDRAQTESEESFCKAEVQGQEIVNKAQAEGQEVISRAQQEALAIISASKARAASMESNASLRAEFIIRQMRQKVADAVQSVVMEMCSNPLTARDDSGEKDEIGSMVNTDYDEWDADAPVVAGEDSPAGTHVPDKPSAKNKARSSSGSNVKTSGKSKGR